MKIVGIERDEVTRAVRSGDVTIAVHGLGKMGFPLAVAFAEAGARVRGVDPDRALVDRVNLGENPHPLEGGLSEVVASLVSSGRLSASVEPCRADVHVTLVPTVLDEEKRPDLGVVRDVMTSISALLEPGDLVVEESTLPPGTCAHGLYPILLRSGLAPGEFGFAHAPERTASGRALADIKGAYVKIVGGMDAASTAAAAGLYSAINALGVIEMSSITAAEAVKVFEGLYRDTNIALANELAIISRYYGIDCTEVIAAANTQPYSHIHQPGTGVGGHCIPVYPHFVSGWPEAEMIRLARRRNEGMPVLLVRLALDELKRLGVEAAGARVVLLGVAFRPGVKEARYSPFLSARDRLTEAHCDVHAWDPLYGDGEIAAFGVTPARSVEGMDAAIVITDHPEFRALDWAAEAARMRHPVVADGRFCIPVSTRQAGARLVRIDGY